MVEGMRFPDTVEEFMDQYKVVDREGIYMSKGSELVPIFRMNQWIEYEKAQLSQEGTTKDATFDLISRQAAIDAAKHAWAKGLEPSQYIEIIPPAQPEHDAEFWRKCAEKYSDICFTLTAEMTKGVKFNSIRIDENGICFGKEQPEQQWIPVSERLPEAKQRVLVTFPDGTVDIKMCIDAGHLKWFFAHMIAWMPLPEPYQSEEERRTE